MDINAAAKTEHRKHLGLILLLVAALVLLAICGAGFYLFHQKQVSLDASDRQLRIAHAQLDELKKQKQRPLIVFGDSRTNHAAHEKVVDQIYNATPEAVFHVGDAVEDGTKPELWQIFNRIEDKLMNNYNFYIAAGNHDGDSKLYYDNFSLPGNENWYSVNYQGIHWIVLNSNLDLMPGSPQYSWLEADLATQREKINFTAVVLHQSLYTSANHAKDDVPYKTALVALLQKYGVKVVFSGHDHNYERSYDGKIYYLVCGSAGAPLYQKQYNNPYSQKFESAYNYCAANANNNTMTITAYNDSSDILDKISITK